MDKMLQRILGEDVELVSRPSSAAGKIKVDPSHIEQVILNLVVNARDAMPTGGKLTIEAENVDLDEEFTAGPPAHEGRAARDARRDRHGYGHRSRDAGAHLRAVLHDQGAWEGHRPRALDRVRDRAAERAATSGSTASRAKGRPSRSICPGSTPRSTFRGRRSPPRRFEARRPFSLVEDEEQVRTIVLNILRRQGYQVMSAPSTAERRCSSASGIPGRFTCCSRTW